MFSGPSFAGKSTGLVVLVLVAWATASQLTASQKTSVSRPTSGLIKVNGLDLHYVDWGGGGDVLLFLTGLGGSGYDFNPLAGKLTGSVSCGRVDAAGSSWVR